MPRQKKVQVTNEQIATFYASKIEDLLFNAGIEAELENYEFEGDTLVISFYIEGDFRHSHMYADALVKHYIVGKYFPKFKLNIEEIEDDDLDNDYDDYDDYYGSTHVYYFELMDDETWQLRYDIDETSDRVKRRMAEDREKYGD